MRDYVSAFFYDCALTLLDDRICELIDATALQADDVVMRMSWLQLKYGDTGVEHMPLQDADLGELVEHTVNGREPELDVLLEHASMDVLCVEVPAIGVVEDLEHFESRTCHFETGMAELFCGTHGLMSVSLAVNSCVDLLRRRSVSSSEA